MRLIAKLLKFFANRVRRQGGNPIGEGRWRRWSLFLRLFNWDPSQGQYPRSQYHYRGPRIDYWGPPHEVRVIANAARLCLRGAWKSVLGSRNEDELLWRQSEVELCCGLHAGDAPLHLNRYGVHVAEASFEWIALEDCRRAGFPEKDI